MPYHWTDEEESVLRDMWSDNTASEISKHIDRSTSAIVNKASRMGLEEKIDSSMRSLWTDSEEDTLRELWPDTSSTDIATVLGRTKNSVWNKARRLGLDTGRGRLPESGPMPKPDGVEISVDKEWEELSSGTRHYHRNKESALKRKKEWSRKRRVAIYEWINRIKGEYGCTLCEEGEPACIDFHHINTKESEVADLVHREVAVERIADEVEKCITLCANCHRKYHADIVELPKDLNTVDVEYEYADVYRELWG